MYKIKKLPFFERERFELDFILTIRGSYIIERKHRRRYQTSLNHYRQQWQRLVLPASRQTPSCRHGRPEVGHGQQVQFGQRVLDACVFFQCGQQSGSRSVRALYLIQTAQVRVYVNRAESVAVVVEPLELADKVCDRKRGHGWRLHEMDPRAVVIAVRLGPGLTF